MQVPKLYTMLNRSTALDQIKSSLNGKPWVWVGDGFVTTNQVAFEAPPNAKPYLTPVPPELEAFTALLRSLGVRESFSPIDYVAALEKL